MRSRLRRAYPERVAFAATFDAQGSDRPEWLAKTRQQLDAALAAGAVAVKVWKDIGMQWRDPDGHVVMIDDARFAPVFHLLDTRGVVVLGHQGEPRNAWLPLAQMTINGDREYFSEHPNYHMALHPEWPTYEQQLAARDRMLDAHPGLHFVGVHLASLEWDVDRVAAFLDRYPKASVDLAARMPHLQRQAVDGRDRVRAFFIKYQDRILYGTDITREQRSGRRGASPTRRMRRGSKTGSFSPAVPHRSRPSSKVRFAGSRCRAPSSTRCMARMRGGCCRARGNGVRPRFLGNGA